MQRSGVSRETYERLARYVSILQQWNPTLNLFSRRQGSDAWLWNQVYQSLALVPLLPSEPTTFTDLGSGGGLPALPIAIATRHKIELIEADRRKAAFLETAMATLDLKGRVWPCRIEAAAIPKASYLTARALAPLTDLLALAYPVLAPGGTALFLKGAALEHELDVARASWRMQTHIICAPEGCRILKVSELEPMHGPRQP